MLGVSKRVLMSPPTFFGVTYAINPHMGLSREEAGGNDPVDAVRALQQWTLLEHALYYSKIFTYLIAAVRGLPDTVFTANAGFIYKNNIVLSNFRHKERAPEHDIFKDYFSRTKRTVIEMPAFYKSAEGDEELFFEGHGDALFYMNTVLAGHGFRSNELGICEAMRAVDFRGKCLLLQLVNPYFYHLDTCLCAVGDTILYYPDAFSAESQKSIEQEVARYGGRLVPVSEEDAYNFVCNAIPVWTDDGWRLITTRPTDALLERLERLNIEVYPVELGEFLKSGGGARCLVLFI